MGELSMVLLMLVKIVSETYDRVVMVFVWWTRLSSMNEYEKPDMGMPHQIG